MKTIESIISEVFCGNAQVKEKRTDIYQLYLPVFHEDGDMIDIFITPLGNDKFIVSDYGQTIMRLSYSYDIDTPNKEGILSRIITENKMEEQDGKIVLETDTKNLFHSVMQAAQTYAKVGSMRYFKREVVESLFYEMLDEFIKSELLDFKPVSKVLPIPDRPDLEADYQFSPNGRPVYLFGVKDVAKARLAAISCLEYQRADINFTSCIVHDDFEKLPKHDRSRLTNSCDKQFTTLSEFESQAKKYLERERHGK